MKCKRFVFGCLLIGLCYSSVAISESQWFLNRQDTEENIRIYYRTLSDGNVEFRGETILDASLNSCVAILRDAASMFRWVHNVKRAAVLTIISEREAYSYVVNTTPFPFSQRDSIIHTLIDQDPETRVVTINGRSVPDYIAEKKDYVRIKAVNSFWQFVPLAQSRTKVIFQGYGEPGGNIPAVVTHSTVFAWLVKTELWKLPFYTLKQMKTEIKQEKYQNVELGLGQPSSEN